MSQIFSLSTPPPTRPSFFNLAALTLVLVLVGLGVAYWLDANGKPASTPVSSVFTAPFIEKNLVNVALTFPTTWQNPATRTNDKAVENLDLVLLVEFSATSGLQTLNIHLAPTHQSQPSAQLLNNVYLLQFSQSQLNDISGLIGKPLRQQFGFQSEVVWYDPIAPNPFVAKCIDLGPQSHAPNCLRTVQLTPQIAATYQFNETNLSHWRIFDATVQSYLSQMFNT